MLGKCLDSVKGFDEIIIVDTGSEDDTVEIAKQYTDKVYFFKWCDSFAKARNFAKQYATGDWILSIDADEVLKTPKNFLNLEGLLSYMTHKGEGIMRGLRVTKGNL